MSIANTRLSNWAQLRRTRAERISYQRFSQLINSDIITKRRELASQYIEEHEHALVFKDFEIDRIRGYAPLFLGDFEPFRDARAEAKQFIEACPPDATLESKGTIDFIVAAKENPNFAGPYIGYQSAITKFALNPNIIVPVAKYFGMLPILSTAAVCRSRNEEFFENSSQLFHLDPLDITLMKLFIYLNDVDEDIGPFTALPADLSEQVISHFNYGIGRLTDAQIAGVVGPKKEQIFTGVEGTGIFCDTNRCFHFGSRPGRKFRHMLFFMYILPTSTWFPLFPGDGTPERMVWRSFAGEMSPLDRILLGMDMT